MMKKNVRRYILSFPVLVLILAFHSCTSEISPEQADRFIKFYGNQYMDEARDLEILEDGSYAICGIDSVSREGKRAVLLVTDKFGNPKQGFPRYYQNGSNPSAANTLVLKRGGESGFLLVGYTEVPVPDTVPPIESRSQKDLFLVRTDKNGGILWSDSFGSSEDETVLHATEMISTGGFMLAGYQVKEGKKDIMIMGVTDQGDSIKLGINYFGGPSINNAAANYILNTGEQYLALCTYDKVGSDGTDILILDFDNELSANVALLSSVLPESGMCVQHIEDNQYVVLGNRTNAAGNSEIMLYRITIQGILIEDTVPLTPISESGVSLKASRIRQKADGGFVVIGTRESGGTRDLFLQFLDSNLQAGERIIFGAAGAQSGADIELPVEGGMLMLGTNGTAANSMISLIKTGDAGEL